MILQSILVLNGLISTAFARKTFSGELEPLQNDTALPGLSVAILIDQELASLVVSG